MELVMITRVAVLFRRKIQWGNQLGKKIGFPTLNFNVGSFKDAHSFGVYVARVDIAGKQYQGALFFGPKFGPRNKLCLEVYVLGLHRTIYRQRVTFEIIKKIRGAKRFKSVDRLKKQIERDVKAILKF
ncbi:riboflavin kinase [Candidatus Peregrinibacteria bacterium]|nr:riboflavin kinase [Candidatus Peregrinibacteria bacterium]